MRAIIEPPPEPGAPASPLWRRLAWFLGLAFAAGAAVAGVACLLRSLLP